MLKRFRSSLRSAAVFKLIVEKLGVTQEENAKEHRHEHPPLPHPGVYKEGLRLLSS